MKLLKKVFAVWTISILLLSGLIVLNAKNVEASICDGVLNLPQVPVTLTVYDNQVTSYFNSVLSNVPAGFDVTDGTYPGWCIQVDVTIDRGVGYQVMLYSSYDPAMPGYLQDDDWDKVNYILNNRNGYAEDYVSIAIWYFINEVPANSEDLNYLSKELVDAANAYGEYMPPCDGVIAVIADPGEGIQRSIFELTIEEERYTGLTPGFWKNHPDAWVDTPYTPGQALNSVFASSTNYFPDVTTLMQALGFKGGRGLAGAAQILLRAAVAAVLNAGHPDINYPLSGSEIISRVNSALNSDRSAMLNLASELDTYNNLEGVEL